jgi:hypothetical protein
MVARTPADGLSLRAIKNPRRIAAHPLGEETMTALRSSRRLIKIWHRREKATLDHLVDTSVDRKTPAGTTHSAFTSSGLAIEDQVRKAWRPCSAGLAIF